MAKRILFLQALILAITVIPALAQSGPDLYQRGLTEEQLGHYDAAIQLFERVIKDFPKDRALAAKAALHRGYALTRSGEAKGIEALNKLIEDYAKDQPAVVDEARRFIAAQKRAVEQAPKWTEYDLLLVAEFANPLAPVVESLNAALILQLEQSPYLNLYPYNAVRSVLSRLRYPATTPITLAVAREVCGKIGAKGILQPRISGASSTWQMQLEVVRCSDGSPIVTVPAEGAGTIDMLTKLGKATSALRAALGEPAESIRRFDSPRALTTNSLAALDFYRQASRARAQNTLAIASFALLRAVQIDPGFASAYSFLASLALDNPAERRYATEAYRLRDRVSEREKLIIEAQYQSLVLGDIDKAIESLQGVRDLYPRDSQVHAMLGDQYRLAGQFEKGLQELLEAARLNPESVTARESLMRNYLELGRFSDAKTFFDESASVGLDTSIPMHRERYAIAVSEGDEEVAQRELAWFNVRGVWHQSHEKIVQAERAFQGGDLAAAQQPQEALFERAPMDGLRHYLGLRQARALALYGETEKARALEAATLKYTGTYRRPWMMLMIHALSGDTDGAQALKKEIEEKYPGDALMTTIWIPTAMAALEVQKGNAAAALKLLEPAKKYEPSLDSMQAVYVRGLAYLQTEDGKAAAAEFQKIIDHRGVDLLSPLIPMAHLKIASAYTLMGDKARARKAYQEFRNMWRTANPDVALMREAEAKFGQQ